jgi:hypothetical protein
MEVFFRLQRVKFDQPCDYTENSVGVKGREGGEGRSFDSIPFSFSQIKKLSVH